MPKEKTITVYQYNELSEKAQQKARDWFLSCDDMDFEWDNLKEDANMIGLKLTSMDERSGAEGELILDFSQVLTLILSNHGAQCETYKTALDYQNKRAQYSEEQIENREDEDIETEFLNSLLEDYRIMWQKTIEYHYSDEYISEMMEANDYEFDINGKRI